MAKVDRVIYQFWTTRDPMSDTRRACLASSVNLGVPTKLVTPDNLDEFVLASHPLHECYEFLTPNHRSDYLRAYFLHFYGGGYADIKPFGTDNNWSQSFDLLDSDPNLEIVGSAEVPGGEAVKAYSSVNGLLLSNGFFIARPRTEFTRLWFKRVEDYLSVMRRLLRRHAETGCGYPIPYVRIQGCNFHLTCREVATHRPQAMARSLRIGRVRGAYR